MKALPESLQENLQGSLADGRIEFTAWYDGKVVAENLPVSTWSISHSAGTQTRCNTTIVVQDESGRLAPWGVDDPLGVGGAQLQTRLVLADSSVNLAWQRITASNPTEVWRMSHDGRLWISGGALIEVKADDKTVMVSGNKFMTPESPVSNNGIIAEIRRLMYGIMDVMFEIDEASSDLTIPSSITYKESRMDAVEDLVTALGCDYRISGTGQFVVYKPNTTSVWTVEGGPVAGTMMQISRSQTITNLNNVVVAKNTLSAGQEIMDYAEETTGPLRVDGPHGRWPLSEQIDFAENIVDLKVAAENRLTQYLHSRTVDIPMKTVFHPGIELGDWVTVMCPVTSGSALPMQGRVQSIKYGGNNGLPVSMDITLQVQLTDVQAVSDALRVERWNNNG